MSSRKDCPNQRLVPHDNGCPERARISPAHLFSKYGLTAVVCEASAWPQVTSSLARPFLENLQQPCILFPNRIEEVKGFQAVWLEKTEKYEKENCGGFRLIYPTLNAEKYEKFFQGNNSLFQNTVASRAREVYAR